MLHRCKRVKTIPSHRPRQNRGKVTVDERPSVLISSFALTSSSYCRRISNGQVTRHPHIEACGSPCPIANTSSSLAHMVHVIGPSFTSCTLTGTVSFTEMLCLLVFLLLIIMQLLNCSTIRDKANASEACRQ